MLYIIQTTHVPNTYHHVSPKELYNYIIKSCYFNDIKNMKNKIKTNTSTITNLVFQSSIYNIHIVIDKNTFIYNFLW